MAEANLILRQMQGVRAFILYRLDGTDKIPIDPYSGFPCSPHDPAAWMLPSEAQVWAHQYGPTYGVGVVISEDILLPNGLRLFCLDLDGCRDGDRWMPHAAAFCARFPGALIECSVSGKGLHVFACYSGERPAHGAKNSTYKMELYSRLRFIAVTGEGATGDALLDCTRAFHALAAEFFHAHDDAEYGDTLTDAPVADWSGPTDDDELLQRMMRSQSGASVFGGRASFAHLWEGNAEILSRTFPAFKNTAWDESAADQALANHCAFWTGNHGERIERLMRRSALVRSKWDARPTYLRDTINRACASQRQWYSAPRVTVEAQAQTEPAIGGYLTVRQQIDLFAGCVYVQDLHQIMMPSGITLSSERFDAQFSGHSFIVTADGQRPARRAWDAFVHSELHRFPKVRGTFFDPRRPPSEIANREGHDHINAWLPVNVSRKRGDASPFVNHVRRILPQKNDADILLSYLKACAQHPGHKFQWWPLIQGVEGNGKTFISKLLEGAVGHRYTHWPKSSEVGSKFNSAFYGKILVCVEDVYISESRGSLWETLKPMITGDRLEIEAKGVDKVTREVCFNGVMNSNHKNGIRKTRNDRRICPFFCAQQNEADLERDGLTEEYFRNFRRWVEGDGGPIVADYLLSEPIPSQWNPATTAGRAPRTTATEEAISAGLGSIEQEVIEAIEQGHHGFRGGWVSSVALDKLLAVIGKSQSIPRGKRRELLASVGYEPHPALPNGRSTTLDIDGSRPILYVHKDAQGVAGINPADVLAWYRRAQG